jgi:hypothetical protein
MRRSRSEAVGWEVHVDYYKPDARYALPGPKGLPDLAVLAKGSRMPVALQSCARLICRFTHTARLSASQVCVITCRG